MNAAQTVLERIVQGIEGEGLDVHGLHVLVGDDVATHRWTPDVREDIHSAAKGVSVLAAGIAADEGLLDLDAPVSRYLRDAEFGAGTADVTVRRLLTMTSGVDLPWTPTLFDDWPDLALEFLRRPSRGVAFQYSNASTYTAMRALGAVVGDVRDWLVPRLFAPLGIAGPEWDRCPHGWIKAGEGLHLRTSELALVGRLIRDRGDWDGQRLVSPEWVDAMHSDWVRTGGSDAYDRYALAGWGGPGRTWRLHGAYGQLLVFAGASVVTITANELQGGDRLAALAVEALDA